MNSLQPSITGAHKSAGMKLTVHLEITNTDFGHFSDAAERAGLSLEQYLVSAALCGSAVLDQEVTP